MKTENEIRQDQTRKVLNEVIEKLRYYDSHQLKPEWAGYFAHAQSIIQSMLPKEEVDWSKASKQSRLKYAQENYKEYLRHYISAGGIHAVDVRGVIVELYSIDKNKWAEIVSEPVMQDEEIKSYVPKSGDEIEYCFDEPNGWAGGIYIGNRGELHVVWTGMIYLDAFKIRTIQPTKRPSLVEAERIFKEFTDNSPYTSPKFEKDLTELIEKLILKNKE